MTKPNPKPGQWDIFYSSYYWIINLDPKHPTNTTDRLTGYSKKVNQSENQDRELLLRRKIVNLFLNGYLNRATSIQIFARKGDIIDKRTDPQILVLTLNSYSFGAAYEQTMLKLHGQWLENFYSLIRRKAPDSDYKNLVPIQRKPVSKDEFLNVSNYSFTSIDQLYSHAARLARHGHAEGQINHFIHTYKQLKNWQ